MYFLFVQCILVDNLDISSGTWRFCYVWLFVCGALICFILCFVSGRQFLFVVKEFGDSSYFLATVCKGDHFVLWRWESVCIFAFLGEGVSHLCLCYTRCCVICFWWCSVLFLLLFSLLYTCVIDLVGNYYLIIYVGMDGRNAGHGNRAD